MSGGRWWRRAAAAVAVFAVLYPLLVVVDAGPDPLRLGLLVVVSVAVLGLLRDALADQGASWTVDLDLPSVRHAGDPRLARYVNLVEAHLAARTDDAALRDRLRVLASQVLRQRYGLERDDPRAAELLGPDLTAVLDGPVRRLRLTDVDHHLTRIEEL